jgi:hypothetical protein
VTRVSPTPRALLTSLCAASALVLVPAAARADQYVVDHCQTPQGAPAAAFPSITGDSSNNCGVPTGGLHYVEPGASVPPGGNAHAIVLAIPADRPNLQIERVISTFSMAGAPPPQGAGGTNGFGQLHVSNGNGDLVYSAAAQTTPIRPTLDLTLPPGNRSLSWIVFCGGATCTWSEPNILSVFGNRLYLNESVAPTLSVTGGTLSGAGAKSGRMSLGFDAADPDSGVKSVSVTIGGTVVGAVDFPCAFNDWSACPRDEKSQLLQVDTAKVPDGNQELVVTVRDAANNALARSLGLVTVANGGAVPNGPNPSRLAKITARFTTSKKTSRRLRYTATPTVKGVLVDDHGQPITGATVAVLARLKQSGARDAQAATAQTGADGGFSLKLPSGPSRTITFAYTAFSGDAKPAATARLRTTVRATVSARIAPRSVRAGKSITLSGRLGPLPRKGIEVTMQARQGSKWRTIDGVRTTSGGAFRWRYRFSTRQARRTYAFRARVASQNYPFAAASSKAALVRVR